MRTSVWLVVALIAVSAVALVQMGMLLNARFPTESTVPVEIPPPDAANALDAASGQIGAWARWFRERGPEEALQYCRDSSSMSDCFQAITAQVSTAAGLVTRASNDRDVAIRLGQAGCIPPPALGNIEEFTLCLKEVMH